MNLIVDYSISKFKVDPIYLVSFYAVFEYLLNLRRGHSWVLIVFFALGMIIAGVTTSAVV